MEMRGKAYCPYSDFRVGAAVLTQDGTIFTGQGGFTVILTEDSL